MLVSQASSQFFRIFRYQFNYDDTKTFQYMVRNLNVLFLDLNTIGAYTNTLRPPIFFFLKHTIFPKGGRFGSGCLLRKSWIQHQILFVSFIKTFILFYTPQKGLHYLKCSSTIAGSPIAWIGAKLYLQYHPFVKTIWCDAH